MKRNARILVVDDEPRYVWTMRVNLEARGYEVLTAGNGQEALSAVIAQEPDLIILDIKMPEMNGYEVCKRVRQFTSVPIIMLTALAQETNLIQGLSLGADDYVTKPFSIDVLLARVRAALRRAMLEQQNDRGSLFERGELRIDLDRERVWVDSHEISLTPLEYRLLYEFVQNIGRILVPDYLLEHVWGETYVGDNALLRQVIYRLRQKIEPDPHNPRYIQTRLGSGYVFTADG
jgi:DNA-binding response OmpR family regulator